MSFRITLLLGNTIDPTVWRVATRIIYALNGFCNYEFEVEERAFGEVAIRGTGTPLPESTIQACLDSDAILAGMLGEEEFQNTNGYEGPKVCLQQLRSILGGFVNLTPVFSFKSAVEFSPLQKSKIEDADVLVVRELPHRRYFTDDLSEECPTRYCIEGIERVAHVAFEQARARRKRLASINTEEYFDKLRIWRSTMTTVARFYPDVKLEHMSVDRCAMNLVMNPKHFDVIVTPNPFGDILAGEAAAIVGSLGMLPSVTMAGKTNLYEVVFGPVPGMTRVESANPIGVVEAIAMLLRYSAGMHPEADDLESAIRHVLDSGYRPDMAHGGINHMVSTTEMGSLIEQMFTEMLHRRFAYHAV